MSNDSKVAKTAIKSYKQLDDGYIESYTNNPKAGKSAAIVEAGYKGNFARQEAGRLHKRLASKIHDAFTQKIKNLEGKAIQNIEAILDTPLKDVGVANMLATSKAALEFAGRKAADTLVVKQVKTIDDLDSAISDNIKQIATDENKTINQVLKELQSPVQH